MYFDVRGAKVLKPGEHLSIDGCPGLRLVATATKRTWTYRYKAPADGRMKQIAIGPYPAMAAGEGGPMKGICLLPAALLVGCASTSHQVSVPLPIECRVAEPARPAMPSEALAPGVDLDHFVAALTAEIEIREGYEGELIAALQGCLAPLAELKAAGPKTQDAASKR